MADMTEVTGSAVMDGTLRSAISQAITQIHAEYYGKGATRAKTYGYDNLIVCVLRDVLTTVEQTLVEQDRADAVRDVRMTFQHAMADRFITAVETITGRRVDSFMSQIDPPRGVAVEVFVLEP